MEVSPGPFLTLPVGEAECVCVWGGAVATAGMGDLASLSRCFQMNMSLYCSRAPVTVTLQSEILYSSETVPFTSFSFTLSPWKTTVCGCYYQFYDPTPCPHERVCTHGLLS